MGMSNQFPYLLHNRDVFGVTAPPKCDEAPLKGSLVDIHALVAECETVLLSSGDSQDGWTQLGCLAEIQEWALTELPLWAGKERHNLRDIAISTPKNEELPLGTDPVQGIKEELSLISLVFQKAPSQNGTQVGLIHEPDER